ncbi:hypothetical protein MNEG_15998 [Monoraphidium neglectum]|uniref:Uncharacterized protein n=1 Tax=Monoraphidium neglectum TaxID=145388 RepID=A0A0D2M965_9CHLO|nr:hypothetical protein MNEG_15998 [Monoraphidium neglectum]KIY91965.1 hypothetical protein MNEG_15998 [Monoraphidium neglectum]|eukprot:XP_013890985.1 hypothetical protein MNEG_15998 [Monoraphidium neglectum]
MEFNESKQEHEAQRFSLEQRILELEAGRMERFVKAEDHAALADARDEINRRLRDCQDDLERSRRATAAAEEQLTESRKEVARLSQLLEALEASGAGDTSAMARRVDGDDDDYIGKGPGGRGAKVAGGPKLKVNLGEIRQQLQRQRGLR